MKFKNEIDKVYYEVTNQNEEIIRNKLLFVTKSIKDRNKSKNTKDFWRRNAYKMRKALKKWHSSVQGKRFHRNLGRFLATHLLKKDLLLNVNNEEIEITTKNIQVTMEEISDILLALNNIKTHLIIELQYFEKDISALEEFFEIFYNFISLSYQVEVELLKGYVTGNIDNEVLLMIIELFLFFIDDKIFLYSVREKLGLSNDKNIDESVNEDLQNITDNKLKNISFIISKIKDKNV